MANVTNSLANAVLDTFTDAVTAAYTAFYLALSTTTVTLPAGTGFTEVSGSAYARVQLTSSNMSAAASGSKTNSATIAFPTATGSWGTVTWVGIYSASTVGTLLWAAALTTSKTIGNGDTFEITAGNLTVTLS